jgi:GT2 family glycosyltransferase
VTVDPGQQQSEGDAQASAPRVDDVALGPDYATWLTTVLLLVLGPSELPIGEGEVVLSGDDSATTASFRSILLPPSGEAAAEGQRPQTLLMALLPEPSPVIRAESLSIRAADAESSRSIDLTPTDLGTIMRACKATLDEGTRESALELVGSTVRSNGISSIILSKRLLIIREALRRRPIGVVVSPDHHQGAAIEMVVAANDTGFYIQGWMRDDEAPVERLTALSPEGERVEIFDRLFRYPRPDVGERYDDPPHLRGISKLGFIASFELTSPSLLQDGWILEMENEAGTEAGITTPRVVSDVIVARREILEHLPFEALPDEKLMAESVFPAIDLLQQRARELSAVRSVTDYGRVTEGADVSIVIPLYKEITFLEHQLAQFAHDPELERAELVCVLDSPELDGELRDYASHLFRLYRIPFRVVTMAHGGGYAAATNRGVEHSSGRLLLLLNSDVIPDRPGWLGRMQDFYDAQDNIGALGVKLLYEDDALQHAGMYFEVVDDTALAGAWANVHYFKGMNRDLAPANVARRVPAVTGACLMIARDLFDQAGGLSDVYVQGDHEDSELCLRQLEAGRENWYLPEVELYHLEGQSYDSTLRGMTALYNRWLHTRRWGDLIASIMTEYPRPGAADDAPTAQASAALPVRR